MSKSTLKPEDSTVVEMPEINCDDCRHTPKQCVDCRGGNKFVPIKEGVIKYKETIYWETNKDRDPLPGTIKERMYFSIPGFFSFWVGFTKGLTADEQAIVTRICTNPGLQEADEDALDYPDLAWETGLHLREEVYEKLGRADVAYADSFQDDDTFFFNQFEWERDHRKPGKWRKGGYKG